MKMKRLNYGFQLVELLVVFSVISILTALSIPVYSNLIEQSERIEAQQKLSKLALLLEHYYFQYDTYEGATLSALNVDPDTSHHSFHLHLESLNPSSFLISATHSKPSKDNRCIALTLNSLGEKGMKGSGKISDCW